MKKDGWFVDNFTMISKELKKKREKDGKQDKRNNTK